MFICDPIWLTVCAVIRTVYTTCLYLLYYCNYIRVKYVMCAISCGCCSLIGLLVVMSIVVVLVLLLFSFPGGWDGGVPVHLFFIVCYCFLFRIGCVLSN